MRSLPLALLAFVLALLTLLLRLLLTCTTLLLLVLTLTPAGATTPRVGGVAGGARPTAARATASPMPSVAATSAGGGVFGTV